MRAFVARALGGLLIRLGVFVPRSGFLQMVTETKANSEKSNRLNSHESKTVNNPVFI